MLWFSSEPPVDEQTRLWIEQSMKRLIGLFGKQRMLKTKVVLPIEESFPDSFDGTEKSLYRLLKRVCGYMKVDPDPIELNVLVDPTQDWKEILPSYSSGGPGIAGTYHRKSKRRKIVITLNVEEFKDSISLVATLAHELSHVLLLGDEKIREDEPDMEPLTDLMTVFTGMGIFNANSVFRFGQYTDGNKIGWTSKSLGYLTQQMFGYALAVFAAERGEADPPWAKYLTANVRSDFKKSMKFISGKA